MTVLSIDADSRKFLPFDQAISRTVCRWPVSSVTGSGSKISRAAIDTAPSSPLPGPGLSPPPLPPPPLPVVAAPAAHGSGPCECDRQIRTTPSWHPAARNCPLWDNLSTITAPLREPSSRQIARFSHLNSSSLKT